MLAVVDVESDEFADLPETVFHRVVVDLEIRSGLFSLPVVPDERLERLHQFAAFFPVVLDQRADIVGVERDRVVRIEERPQEFVDAQLLPEDDASAAVGGPDHFEPLARLVVTLVALEDALLDAADPDGHREVGSVADVALEFGRERVQFGTELRRRGVPRGQNEDDGVAEFGVRRFREAFLDVSRRDGVDALLALVDERRRLAFAEVFELDLVVVDIHVDGDLRAAQVPREHFRAVPDFLFEPEVIEEDILDELVAIPALGLRLGDAFLDAQQQDRLRVVDADVPFVSRPRFFGKDVEDEVSVRFAPERDRHVAAAAEKLREARVPDERIERRVPRCEDILAERRVDEREVAADEAPEGHDDFRRRTAVHHDLGKRPEDRLREAELFGLPVDDGRQDRVDDVPESEPEGDVEKGNPECVRVPEHFVRHFPDVPAHLDAETGHPAALENVEGRNEIHRIVPEDIARGDDEFSVLGPVDPVGRVENGDGVHAPVEPAMPGEHRDSLQERRFQKFPQRYAQCDPAPVLCSDTGEHTRCSPACARGRSPLRIGNETILFPGAQKSTISPYRRFFRNHAPY